jgi:leucyl aminopeptidase
MQYRPLSGDIAKTRADCLLLGVRPDAKLDAIGAQVNHACGGVVQRLLTRGDFTPDKGATLLIPEIEGLAATRVLLVGLGAGDARAQATQMALGVAKAREVRAADLLLALPEAMADKASAYAFARALALASEEQLYRFDRCKSLPDKTPPAPHRLSLLSPSGPLAQGVRKGLTQGQAIAAGVRLAKDLGNLPGNLCTPSYLAAQARALGRNAPTLKVSVLDEARMTKLGMGALLSVSRGSREPAKLIVMEYRGGASDQRPVVLVGKGLTFDAGGISIKPADAMDEMKYDMCGGASVIGVMQVAKSLALPINLIGLVPSSENLPDGAANKPGDIVTSMAGLTIEILNTDAEGRLILCDALTYARRFEPESIIDIATLTGACVVALGNQASGLMSNDEALAEELLAAGQSSGDRAWRLPLWDEYQEQLKSNFADLANIGGRPGGAITAACFLSRFTRELRWAHLDIAGTAWKSGKDKGATGRPVALLCEMLLRRCKLAE